MDQGCLLLGRDYFECNDFQLDCGFGGRRGGWGLEEKGKEREEVFPDSATEMTHILGPSPVSVFRGQLCPGRAGPWNPLFYSQVSPVPPKAVIHKYVLPESTAPLGLPCGQPGGGEAGQLRTQTGC